jgi:hypothetical protein
MNSLNVTQDEEFHGHVSRVSFCSFLLLSLLIMPVYTDQGNKYFAESVGTGLYALKSRVKCLCTHQSSQALRRSDPRSAGLPPKRSSRSSTLHVAGPRHATWRRKRKCGLIHMLTYLLVLVPITDGC